jgi:hypothetical protein
VTIYRIPTPCPVCLHAPCRCAQDPLSFTVECSRCDRVSDAYESADELEEDLEWLGWNLGHGRGYCDFCPDCESDLTERSMRRWATA